jgi:hypothetical protein
MSQRRPIPTVAAVVLATVLSVMAGGPLDWRDVAGAPTDQATPETRVTPTSRRPGVTNNAAAPASTPPTRPRPRDGNGCLRRVILQLLSNQDKPRPGTQCRYDASGRLERSERLPATDLAAALEAFLATPRHPGHDHCIPPAGRVVAVRISADVVATVWFGTRCGDGVQVLGAGSGTPPGHFGHLTQQAMRWAVSPGWTGPLPRDVPRPCPFR